MRIDFLKMQGLGNDFLVFDTPSVNGQSVDSNKLRALADRHTGIGFDQALMLEAPREARSRVFYRVFNSDGSEVEQCGNGARCVAALMYARRPELGRELTMESAAGVVHARVREDGMVSVDMGIPNFEPSSLPMEVAALGAPGLGAASLGVPGRGAQGEGSPREASPGEMPVYSLEIDGANIEFGAVSMGNPHVVLRVPDVKSAPVERFGPTIERHRLFAQRTNVGFMQIVDRKRIKLRVYERGVGETQACGTGACAAVAFGAKRDLLDSDVRVDLPGGSAIVTWSGPGQHIWLTGPATMVFTGSIDI
jgi:diaminopimelate epimerase